MRKQEIEIGDLVRVKWEDAWTNDDYWTLERIASEAPLIVNTFGSVIRNDAGGITVAMEKFEDGRYRRVAHVPRAMVLEVVIVGK